ncbi:lipid-A-disaccharide synthase [Pelodictyon phaeoclathratiforme]|uniref:Lipid-A-disaccharide synthase n=1 Tax=Pelodictyon phaeoclathratiforme (strain DSM 5477 / BU-1) TaxID=324925 RepID=B4SCT5_PELPB|nr:lipid-A-disaccharide synthase [Pelodictyon phaeoclathratiforme]ACF42769.1 lipid-A-disaccharide synthase [Pelodictyon phaeoclathratiforme BU-1]MBV5289740.1 lipid-A-disaccharide synthase [Pelodictyon phaeoclathratiforme]
MSKKLFVLAGELSGDMHAAGVITELLKARPELKVFGIGGEKLRTLGAELLYDTAQMSIMGFLDVLKHAGFLRRVIRELKEAIRREKPQAAFLVDYPGMNLMMARFFHQLGIPVIYYISPQVWAWKEGRVKAIRRDVDRLLVIFDFEVEFFRRHGINAEFVGHPVIEQLAELSLPSRELFVQRYNLAPDTLLIGLLPGSRKQEIAHILPEMLKAARLLSQNYRVVFLFGRAPHLDEEVYHAWSAYPDLSVINCSAYEVMQYSDLALVTSGTATLESLCFGVPMVVVYRTGWLNYLIGRQLVKLTSISLANIVAKGLGSSERAVPELIQHEASGTEIYQTACTILDDPEKAGTMRRELLAARERLASDSPSHKIAAILQEYL